MVARDVVERRAEGAMNGLRDSALALLERSLVVFLAVASLADAAPAGAAEDGVAPDQMLPRTTSHSEESIGVSVNRLGLQHVLGVRWARPLFRSASVLLADAQISAGVAHTLTPAYMRADAWVAAAPLSVLGLRLGLEPGAYFGTFGSLASSRSYSSWPVGGAPGGAAIGGRAYLSPTLRMRIGGFAMTSTAALEWWWASVPGPFYYEPSRDTLLRSPGDRLLTVSALLVHQTKRQSGRPLSYGLSYELTELPAAPGNRSQRLGVVVSRRLASSRLGLDSPTVGLRIAYYLDDPQRQGQLAIALGMSVERGR